jgi:hypothetical protein
LRKVDLAIVKHTGTNYGLVNIGDYIQICAAEQFMPSINLAIERDRLNQSLNNKTLIILNGWFTNHPENWPPNKNLSPLFVSFHLQPASAKKILSKQQNIDFFKKHQPVGCRDYNTLKMLQGKGIKAYFSYCLTSTLDIKYKSTKIRKGVYIVDPLYSQDFGIIKKFNLKKLIFSPPFKKLFKLKDVIFPKSNIEDFIPKDVIVNSEKIEHYINGETDHNVLMRLAKNLLNKYAGAKLVITSRIHCAIPCLSLGTPVLFILKGLSDEDQHMSRFRGILDHINILTLQNKEELNTLFGKKMNCYHPNEIDWDSPPKNPLTFKKLAEDLKKKCYEYISHQHNAVK